MFCLAFLQVYFPATPTLSLSNPSNQYLPCFGFSFYLEFFWTAILSWFMTGTKCLYPQLKCSEKLVDFLKKSLWADDGVVLNLKAQVSISMRGLEIFFNFFQNTVDR